MVTVFCFLSFLLSVARSDMPGFGEFLSEEETRVNWYDI